MNIAESWCFFCHRRNGSFHTAQQIFFRFFTGTFSTEYAHGGVEVQRTCFLDLSAASHGNALGVGLANVITKRFFDKMTRKRCTPTCLTSTVLTSARIPCVVANDREAIQMCIRTCTGIDRSRARIIRIPNSLHIGRIMLSEAYYRDVKAGKMARRGGLL